jgi:hypothetical protein
MLALGMKREACALQNGLRRPLSEHLTISSGLPSDGRFVIGDIANIC